MNGKELLSKVYGAPNAETGCYEVDGEGSTELGPYLSDDFQATYANGSPSMDKSTWLASGKLLYAAIPDILWELEYVGEEGDDVLVNTRMSGTFESDLDLSALGMGIIPATGKRVEMGPAPSQFRFDGDKVCEIHDPRTGPEGGLTDFFKALGVETA